MAPVVTPGFTIPATVSRIEEASLPTLRMPSTSSGVSETGALFEGFFTVRSGCHRYHARAAGCSDSTARRVGGARTAPTTLLRAPGAPYAPRMAEPAQEDSPQERADFAWHVASRLGEIEGEARA